MIILLWKIPKIRFIFFVPFLLLLGQERALASCEEKLRELAIGNPKKHGETFCRFESLKALGMKEVAPTDASKKEDLLSEADWNPCKESLEPNDLALTCHEEDLGMFKEIVERTYNHSRLNCLFKTGLEKALNTATQLLKENSKDYTFFQGTCREKYAILPEEWVDHVQSIYKNGEFKKYISYVPQKECSPSQTMQCFYEDKCATECNLGQEVAQYSMMREYLGDDDFDELFRKKVELVTYNNLNLGKKLNTVNPWFTKEGKKDAIVHSPESIGTLPGPKIMIGLTGGLTGDDRIEMAVRADYKFQKRELHKDFNTNFNQNFVISSFSDEAFKEWKNENINDVIAKLWFMERVVLEYDKNLEFKKKEMADKKGTFDSSKFEYEKTIKAYEKEAMDKTLKHERLVKEGLEAHQEEKKGPAKLQISYDQVEAIRAEVKRLRSSPALAEVKLFVHPAGVMSLLDHLDAQKYSNGDMPYMFKFYPDAINHSIFKMVRDHNTEKCFANLKEKKKEKEKVKEKK